MKEKVLIVGGRAKAKSLAQSLSTRGMMPVLINKSEEDCQKLMEYRPSKVICADGTKPYVLEDLQMEAFCQVIALCPRDEDNLMICRLAKNIFPKVRMTALVSNLANKKFFIRCGVDRVVCAVSLITRMIEQEAFMDEMRLEEGLQIVKLDMEASDAAIHKKLWELSLPSNTVIGSILRQDGLFVPQGETTIMEGDQLVLITSDVQKQEAIQILKGEKSNEKQRKHLFW